MNQVHDCALHTAEAEVQVIFLQHGPWHRIGILALMGQGIHMLAGRIRQAQQAPDLVIGFADRIILGLPHDLISGMLRHVNQLGMATRSNQGQQRKGQLLTDLTGIDMAGQMIDRNQRLVVDQGQGLGSRNPD